MEKLQSSLPKFIPESNRLLPRTDYEHMSTPKHYEGAVTPWDLERCMQSSGNAFVDARRTDAIEYCFRIKEDLLEDLKKARHCLDEAINEMEKRY